jgi:hypothetical protein
VPIIALDAGVVDFEAWQLEPIFNPLDPSMTVKPVLHFIPDLSPQRPCVAAVAYSHQRRMQVCVVDRRC